MGAVESTKGWWIVSTSLYVAIVVYWVGALADWYTTKRAVFDSKLGEEKNPLIAWAIKNGAGEWHLLALKAVIFAVLGVLADPLALWIVGVAYGAMAVWNKTVLRHARR